MTGRRSQIAIAALLLLNASAEPALAEDPVITGQPADYRVRYGGDISLSVTATTGTGTLSYQWYEGQTGDTSTPVFGSNYSQLRVFYVYSETSYWVRVSNGTGSVDSQAAAITVFPGIPYNVSATNGLFQDRIRIRWGQVGGSGAGYHVYRGPTSDFADASLLATLTETVYNDTAAVPGTRYWYFVKAFDDDGDEGDHTTTSWQDGMRATGPLDGVLIPVRRDVDFVFDSTGSRLFITNSDGFVEEYDVNTRTVSERAFLGGDLMAIDGAPDDSFLLVADRKQISETGFVHRIDLSDSAVTTMDYDLGDREGGSVDLAVFSNTRALVSTEHNSLSGRVNFRELNPLTGAFTVRTDTPAALGQVRGNAIVLRNGFRSHGAILERYGSSGGLYFGFDATGNTFDDSHTAAGGELHWGAVSGDGSLIATVHAGSYSSSARIYAPDGTLVHQFPSEVLPAGARFSPQVNELYLADHSADVIRGFETATFQEAFSLPIPGGFDWNPFFGEGSLEISPDGRTLALAANDGIVLFDLSDRIPIAPPDAPTILSATDDSGDHVRLTWTPMAGAEGYAIYRHTADDSAAATMIASFAGTIYEDTTAQIGTNYHYWVKATNSFGPSGFSNGIPGIRVSPALSITTQPVGDTTVYGASRTLTVEATTNSGALTYQWYRGLPGDTSNPLGTDSSTLTLDDLQADESYWVRVSNGTVSQDSLVATIVILPRSPTDTTATRGLFQDKIRVSWDGVATAVNYQVFRGPQNTSSSAAFLAATTNRFYEDTTGVPGTRYWYFIKAVDADGDESGFSVGSLRDGMRAAGPLDGELIPIRDPEDFIFDNANSRLFISSDGGWVDEYDIASRAVTRSWWLGGKLGGIDITPDGTLLFVTDILEDEDAGKGFVHRIDLTDDSVTRLEYDLVPGENGSFDIAVLSGTTALVTTGVQNGPGFLPLRELNPATGNFAVRSDVPNADTGHQVVYGSTLTRNPGRTAAVVLGWESFSGPWFSYDASADAFGELNVFGNMWRWGAVSADGSMIALISGGLKVYSPDGNLIHEMGYSGYAGGMRFSPATNHLYFVEDFSDGIRAIDTDTWEELFNLPISGTITGGLDARIGRGNLKIRPDGRTLALATDEGVELFDLSERLPPDIPANVTATDDSTDRITVSWDAAAGADTYSIYRHTSDDPMAATLLASGVAGTLFHDNTAAVGVTYFYWIEAENSAGRSDFSESGSGMRRLAPPWIVTQPADQTVEFGDATTLTVAASTNAGALDYQWYRGSVGDLSDPVGTNQSSLNLSNQMESAGFWVRVSNAAGTIDSRVAVVTVIPKTPTGIGTTNLVGGVQITWSAAPGAAEYRVHRGPNPSGFASIEIATVGLGTVSYLDTSGGAGLVYYYFVRAASPGGLSSYSAGVVGERLHAPPPVVSATNGYYDDKIRVSWEGVAGAEEYLVSRNTVGDVTGSILVGRVGPEFQNFDDGVATAGTRYYYSVRAMMPGRKLSAFSTWAEGERSALETFRPDGLIGKSVGAMLGNGVYNDTGSGQTVTVKSKRRKVLRFFLKLENDGIVADDLTAVGTRGNRLFRATYFEKPATGGRANVTGAVVAGTYQASLGPAAAVEMELHTKRKGRKTRGLKGKTFVLIGTSGNAPDRKDAVKGKVKSG